MKRKAEDNTSPRESKKPKMENVTASDLPTDLQSNNFHLDVWRAIEYFCDMKSLQQLRMISKAFSVFFWNESYKKLYVWRWRHNFIPVDELSYYSEMGEEDLIQELSGESEKSIHDRFFSSNFADPALNPVIMPWKAKYDHRTTLLPRLVSKRIPSDQKEVIFETKVRIYDKAEAQHAQEQARLLPKTKAEEPVQRGRRAQQPRGVDPLSGLPASLEFILIGPSAVPIVVRTEINAVTHPEWYFKASVWSYSTGTWSDLFIHKSSGDESQEQFYSLCYPVASVLYGKRLTRAEEDSFYWLEQFRQLVVSVSQLPSGAYTNTTLYIEKDDPSMENIFD